MRSKNRLTVLLLVLMVSHVCTLVVRANETTGLPKAYLIAGVPHHKQITGLSCGPASLEILYDFWGEDIDQRAITDVTRTSSIGTYTWDMMRAGYFSHLSRAQGRFFPSYAPKAGYPERPLGYVSFSHASDNLWWTDLKGLIARNIPVVLLMKYAPDDATGHYRIIVGYDEENGVVYFVDPWGRDLNKMTNPDGTITWSMTDFKDAWNYIGYGTDRPYWGAVIMPWRVTIHTTGEIAPGSILEVTAEITYPCLQPFDCSAYSAFNVSAEIILPPEISLWQGASRIDIGSFQAGEKVTVTWLVKLDEGGPDSSITVKATGFVSGAVPEAPRMGEKTKPHSNKGEGGDKKNNRNCYPAYDYTDEIGVEEHLEL
ncbi:MAG: C39 family peptidase [Candidatus Brocadia sp.]|nr:C39 family peptidase [Candidatus Brocadia sp.]